MRRLIPAAIFLVGFLIARPQARQNSTQWEFAAVGSLYEFDEMATATSPQRHISRSEICYATDQGCRYQEVRVERPPNTAGSLDGMMKAASMLGDQGFELVSAIAAADGSRVMYFRRQKTEVK